MEGQERFNKTTSITTMNSLLLFSTLLIMLIIGSSRDGGGFAVACNICGCPECDFAEPTAIVTFTYEEKKIKMACAPLQEKARIKTQISDEYCRTTLVEIARFTCRCYFKNGTLLEDFYAETIPPGENATEAPNSSGGGGQREDEDETEPPEDTNESTNEPASQSSNSAATTSWAMINQLLTSVLLVFIWIYSTM